MSNALLNLNLHQKVSFINKFAFLTFRNILKPNKGLKPCGYIFSKVKKMNKYFVIIV